MYVYFCTCFSSISIVIIPFLMEAAATNNSAPNATQRRDISSILLGAYKSLSGCCILLSIPITHYLKPPFSVLIFGVQYVICFS